MKLKRNVFLIGPRACGKTSVGQLLAGRLGAAFIDTDHELVASVGMEIADYIEAEGWDVFRDAESGVLARVAEEEPRVIGCGGGIVLRTANRDILKSGIVLYLKAEPEELAARLARDPNEAQRPSLTGKPIVEEVREVLAERAPLYEGCADAIVSGDTLETVVDRALVEVERLS
ncbi:shikimate kinase AroL [Pseudodesulfovibrio cashew]|uniref:Shikimate kinase n=1 Tax=Pseudodesulfovibrio cashew TaxID=2678688 RepID=A0A6I6JVD7_9BACT|nr:shikimate kinase AroL [Pseudodesulfovibrio cashew]QGY41654.1 shikimate kinase AroL [Pseudodesulfovibrio cashew]